MKKTLLASILGLVTLASDSFGQGLVIFSNFGFGSNGNLDAPITYGSGPQLGQLVPSTFSATLYYQFGTVSLPAGADTLPGGWTAVVGSTTSITEGDPGYFDGGAVIIPGYSFGPISFIVVAHDGAGYDSAFFRGRSPAFTLSSIATGALPVGNFGSFLQPFQVWPPTSLPIIQQPPASQTVTLGSSLNLTVLTLGPGPQTFQWRFNATNLPAATATNYVIAAATANDAGLYDVVVSNSFGAVTSSVAVVQVLPPNAPSIRINNQLAVGTVSAASPASVTISNSFPGGFVFYTLDGGTPTTGSTLYSGPLALTSSATIRAMALSADFSQSGTAPPINLVVLPTYNLTTSVSGGGSISLIPTNGPYLSNLVVTVSASAATNWAFSHWSGDASGSVNSTFVTMNGPRSVQANFNQIAYPLTLSTPGGGSVTANGQSIAPATYYPTGAVVTLAAMPASGWSFLRWQGTTNSTSNPLNLSIYQTNNVQAVFGTTVGTNVAGNGGINLSPVNPVDFGAIVTATALPSVGHYLVTWSQATSGTANPTTFVVTTATPVVGALFAASPAPVISGNPTNTSVVQGSPATFSVTATGAAPLTYQWRKAGANLTAATNASFGIPSAQAADAGSYDVIVYNTYGSSVTSVVATLTVLLPPTIAQQPASQFVVITSNATFSVTAAGTAPFTYAWRKNGAALGAPSLPTYGITGVSSNDGGGFDVVVANPYGSVTSAVATLTIVYPPAITNQPTNLIVAVNTSATFTVGASGTEPLVYQWQGPAGVIPNATNATHILSPVLTNAAGAYSVIVSNPYGAVTSIVAQLTVYIPVAVIYPPLSQVHPAGDTAYFSVTAEGFPAPAYQWLKDGSPISGAISNSLTLPNIWTTDLAVYSVAVWNLYSAVTSAPAWLLMSPSLEVPFTGAVAVWGKDADLTVSAVGSGSLSYQWLLNGAAINDATNSTFTLPAVQFTNQGLYSVVVSSLYGSVTNPPAQLVVNPANVSLGLYAGLTIDGVPGYTYEIQYTTNLAITNSWQTLTNYTLTQPVELWVDTTVNTHNTQKRFYRINAVP